MPEAAPREINKYGHKLRPKKLYKIIKKSSNAIPAVAPSNIAVKGYPRARKEVLPQLQLFSTPIKLRRTLSYSFIFLVIKFYSAAKIFPKKIFTNRR